MRICVYGSGKEANSQQLQTAEQLGELLKRRRYTLVTGGGPGVSKHAFSTFGGYSVAYPAAHNHQQWRMLRGEDPEHYSEINYIPGFINLPQPGLYHYRNIHTALNCDAAVIIGGSTGTLNEVTNCYGMSKPVGLLSGSGGVAELFALIEKDVRKGSSPPCFISDDLEQLLSHLAEVHYKK